MDKRIYLELNKLLKEVFDQIFFPKEDLYGYFFRYGITLVFALILLEFIFFFPAFITLEAFLLLSILFISLNSFLGNIRTAILLTAISFFIAIFYFLESNSNLIILFELLTYLLTSLLLNLLINLSKRLDLAVEFGKREKNYLQQLDTLTIEKNLVIKEIQAHDEFISIASHELKTPLTTTLLKLQTALDNIRNVSLANFSIQNLLDMLESAEQQAQTLGKMINDLLNVSLIRSRRMKLELEETNLVETTKSIIKRYSEKAQKEHVTIELKTIPNLKGFLDRVKIEQVINNLINNALKYGERKSILITISKSGPNGRIAVKDQGIGIPAEIQEKIFNLFERGISLGNHTGLGIGLFVSNQIIKAHKGKILLDSKPGKGSTFIIEIPLKTKH